MAFGFAKKKAPEPPVFPGVAPNGPPGDSFGPPPPGYPEFPEEPSLPAGQQGPPVDQVISMRQQNLTNNQIIQNLQRAGYAQQQIFDAMNQADVKGGVEDMPPPEYEQPAQEMGYGAPPGMEFPPSMGQPMGRQMEEPRGQGIPANFEERIEEVAESILDEKWTDFATNMNKMIDWKDKIESRLDAMDQKIEDLKGEFDKVHSAVLGKIEDYDKNIMNVGAEVKAMEKVFEKVLPQFTENINELSRVTRRVSGK